MFVQPSGEFRFTSVAVAKSAFAAELSVFVAVVPEPSSKRRHISGVCSMACATAHSHATMTKHASWPVLRAIQCVVFMKYRSPNMQRDFLLYFAEYFLYLQVMAISRKGVNFDANRRDMEPYGFVCEKWMPQLTPRPDRHNEIELNITGNLSITYAIAGRVIRHERNSLSLFWAAIPHRIVDTDGKEPYYVVTVPLAWFLGWKLPDAFTKSVLSGRVVNLPLDGDNVKLNMMLFQRWAEDLRKNNADSIETVHLEVEALVRRLAFDRSETGHPSGSLRGYGHDALSKIEQMAAFMASHYTDRILLTDIGKAVGLNPNYAAGVFQKAFGMTPVSFITEHRVSHAQRLLITTDSKIIEIALASGFNTLSRFNKAFRDLCSCTPREYRRLHQTV